jgi:uncharacterized protein YfaS (alpha-2-macroglobulin family)
MKRNAWFLIVLALLTGTGLLVAATGGQAPAPGDFAMYQRLMQEGNFQEAYVGLRALCLNPATKATESTNSLRLAVNCLQRLGRLKEVDELLEQAVAAHDRDWRLLRAAAQQYESLPHQGFLIAGAFERGPHRGGGSVVNSYQRDRVRALQLMTMALTLANADDRKDEVAQFYLHLADVLLQGEQGRAAWRLQSLTDLQTLPDYEEGYRYFSAPEGAPVTEDGSPVFHHVPKNWETAASDGERWRWCLAQAMENSPQRLNEVRWQLAQFCRDQFDVQTMAQSFFGWRSADDEQEETGIFAVHTLKENETIARLATGIKRFELPEEFNHITILQQIAAEPQTGRGEEALQALAEVFENRRQFDRAAEYWSQSIKLYGSGRDQWKQKRLDQIVGAWGRFESLTPQPAGTTARVEFVFRNARQVRLEARPINAEKLLDDVKSYLKTRPRQLDGGKIQIENIGWRLVEHNDTQYLGAPVASWSEDLQPRERHFDRRITLKTPPLKPGAYLVTAQIPAGNTSKIVLWVADTALAHKPLAGKNLYFVADAVSGEPIAQADVEFFGFRHEVQERNRVRVDIKEAAKKTNAEGQVIVDTSDTPNDFNWLIVARTAQGRLAFLGFRPIWAADYYDAEYNEVKSYCITDRPVYRPEQKVHFKFWVRRAQYDQEGRTEFAGQTFAVELHDPKGEKIKDWSLTADQYGGVEGSYDLPANATLGQYGLNIVNYGGGGFRVEEYKKPEYEVLIDSPTEPVMLGDKVSATVQAKYYFGAPVTDATVKYKVTRSAYTEDWYPVAPWDWMYGRGYWWFSYDYPWYPGWHNWVGCLRPLGWWFPRQQDPPEVVAEREVPIGPDGRLTVDIDTSIAKALHGDSDHEYSITAEVRDQSRRTIVGQGKVLVARQPFKVHAWVDRGYYRAGDTIQASFRAQTLAGQPVKGSGILTLYRISYDDQRQPVEQSVQQWQVNTDDEGRAEMKIRAATKGQYRLSYKVTNAKEQVIEGGYLFTITGEGFDGTAYRFNELELIPDQQDYQPGDKVQLQINTDRVGSTVLLFVRPANGVYLPPRMVRLEGKSTVAEIDVIKKDMPNFFVEALVIADGKVHNQIKEIVVPPEKRVLNVEVLPSSTAYKPGEKARVRLHLSDFEGKDFAGSSVVSIYDKSVEYVSGGSNVPEIREFFWKWRRSHQQSQETNLDRWEGNHSLPGKPVMSPIGIFGDTVAEDLELRSGLAGNRSRKSFGFARGYGGGMGGMGGAMMMDMMDGASMRMAVPMAAPAPAGAAAESAPSMMAVGDIANAEGQVSQEAALVTPSVRSEFADTALWVGSLNTDERGIAEVELQMPENLTTWKVKVWGMGDGTKVGSGDAEVVTRKDLIVRLQAPRFLVQKDEAVLSANIHNYLASDKTVTAVLEMPGGQIEPLDAPKVQVVVPADGEKRVDWRVRVLNEGLATIRMQALTDEESDAMEVKVPCLVHGLLKTESWATTVRPDKPGSAIRFTVPAERRVDQSRLEIRYSPTLAGAMVDALPYLADYPYGCTEQTLNRFLPSAITQKVLIQMNLNLDEIRDKQTNLNAQEVGADRERAQQWKRFDRNPVFDRELLNKMVAEGVAALTEMQLNDGGWGWFSGWGEHSSPHTTATVVHGLQVAQENDVALAPGVLERGIEWMKRYQEEQIVQLKNATNQVRPWKDHADNLDALVYMVLVDAGMDNAEMRDFLYRDRNELAVYSKAMFGLSLHKLGDREKLEMILRNLQQFLVQDEENETAYLRLPENNYWWFWYGSENEANAYYLKLLARVDAQGVVAPRLVKYLLNNRKHATYWDSTRDTSLCVEAFADFLRASGEAAPDMVVEIWLDGQKRQEVQITSENLFTFDNKFVLSGADVPAGEHVVEIKRRGKGPVYACVYLTNFTLEDPITHAGLEVKVARKFYKLVPVEKTAQVAGSRGQALEQKVEKYQREPLADLASLKSGELVEVELEMESKNDYEYLMFEDMKAAGFEPVEVRSGYTANGLGAYMELRDQRVTFFVRQLARGKHSISYRLRAETPGRFSALPALGQAMYAPELRGNSDEWKLQITD